MITSLKFLFEKSSGLFFGPVSSPSDPVHEPVHAREKAWLYNDEERLRVIREYYGGDSGAELIDVSEPDAIEFFRWSGRKGGLSKSLKKIAAVRRNGKRNKGIKKAAVAVATSN